MILDFLNCALHENLTVKNVLLPPQKPHVYSTRKLVSMHDSSMLQHSCCNIEMESKVICRVHITTNFMVTLREARSC